MTSPALENDLKSAIRSIPDYPKPAIMFRDITTLLGAARAFRRALDTALITAPEARDPALIKKLDAVAGRLLRS